MPDSTGKFQLQDFDTALVEQGFDAISPDRRTRWVNFAYNRVASEFPWLWEQTQTTITVNPGKYTLDFVTDIPDFRSVDYVYVTSVGYERRLDHVEEADFFERWLALDLSSSQSRGETSAYKVYGDQLYLLPPPQTARAIKVVYHRRPVSLALPTDVPITPKYLDEAILLASLSVAHKRTHELQLAAQMEADLGDWIDQMRIDEEWRDDQLQQRVVPDNTWA